MLARSERVAAAARAWKERSGGENNTRGEAGDFIGGQGRQIPHKSG